MSEHQIVILDDDPDVRKLLESVADADGHAHVAFTCVHELIRSLPIEGADMFLLDISLPDGDGLDVARQVRMSSPDAGIIMITGHHDEVDTVLALELGADDYVTKPFRTRELRARIKSLLRRANRTRQVGPVEDAEPFKIAGLTINRASRSVRAQDGQHVQLTTLEFDVLLALVTPPNRVLSRDRLMDKVRGPDWMANDRAIDGIISRLRLKLFPGQPQQEVIKTIRGIGYMFSSDNQA